MPILTGVRSGSFGNLRSAILASPSAPDDNILLDDDAKRPARTDAKRRLDIEIAGYKLITRPSSALLRGFPENGRATGRERVCQYGYISRVAVSCKKKTQY